MTAEAVRLVLTGAALLAAAFVQGCVTDTAASAHGDRSGLRAAIVPATTAAGVLAGKSVLDADGHERLGDEQLGEGELERAFFEYREALRIEPARVTVRYKAARLLLRQGLLGEAEEEFRTVLHAQPDSARALLGLGHAGFLAGKPETEELLRAALALDPRLWQAHNLLGLLHEREGSSEKAIAAYQAALATNPGEGTASNNLGVALLRAGNDAQAVLAFRRAFEVGCDDPRISNNLGLALARLGRQDEAVAAFRKAGSPAAAWNNLGYVLLTEGRTAEAVAALEKAITANPSHYGRAQENLKRARASSP